jgi:hypothetical protein
VQKEGVGGGVEEDLKNVRNKIRFVLNLQGIWAPDTSQIVATV